jgi:hypothetical protein
METRVFISFAADALIAGILCGVLIYNLLERSANKIREKADRVTRVLTINTEDQRKGSAEVSSENYPLIVPPEIIDQQPVTIRESQKKSRQSAFVDELETNLTISTAIWRDKPIPFKTACWDNKPEKVEPNLASHLQDLIQLYVDISLANNVVWLATELGHRSKELDESYLKLCSGIADRIKNIIPVFNDNLLTRNNSHAATS